MRRLILTDRAQPRNQVTAETEARKQGTPQLLSTRESISCARFGLEIRLCSRRQRRAISQGWFRSPVEGANYRSSGSALPSLNLTLSSRSIKPPLRTSPLAAAANPHTDKPGNIWRTHSLAETLLERLRKRIPEDFI